MSLFDISSISRGTKRLVYFATDTALVPISLYVAFALRYGTATPFSFMTSSWILFPLMTLVGGLVVWAMRLDRIKLNALETTAISRIGLAAVILAASAIVLSYMLRLSGPRSVPLIFGVNFCFFAVAIRIMGLSLLRRASGLSQMAKPVAIYGAGAAGTQLASALWQAREARPAFFIDDNPSLQGLMISGLPVYGPQDIERLITQSGVQQILLAIPSLPKVSRTALINKLDAYPVEVKVLPSYAELMAADTLLDSLTPVAPEDMLGRDKVALDTPEVAKTYAGRVVMVTGAGGSIGSELCRQLLNCNPAHLVLFEQSEFNLYQIDQELRHHPDAGKMQITMRLGSVTNRARVEQVIADHNVDVILHAAAYKHVPLVERNELEGARNNVLGTQIVAEAAAEAGIERFILISTDKAVRPTNIMGATKRMAEMVVQDIQTRNPQTKCAMVRFGNVLGSSGSVLPLFQKQIALGGPVTVTHRDVTRYFMTIPEAARLVLTAGTYATGGDVFVLDMGKPQRIVDIAHRMIALSGRTVKDPVTGKGDIEVQITGLRPGEKLFEELLIDDDTLLPTPHAKILRAQDMILSQIEVAAMLRDITRAIETSDVALLRQVIMARVEGYHIQEDDSFAS